MPDAAPFLPQVLLMSDDLLQRNQALEADNARLRRLLDGRGSTAGLRHQVRNSLAMVRDVVRRSTAHLDEAEELTAHLDSRLDAVFRIQNVIANEQLDGIGLTRLVAGELLAQGIGEGERLSLDGPDVRLRPDAAGMVALAVHELAVNALKFGALSAAQGRLAVRWSVEAGEGDRSCLVLDWTESGVADVPCPPPRRGFGSDLIEGGLLYQFGGAGRLDFVPGGLVCTIHLPLSPSAGAP